MYVITPSLSFVKIFWKWLFTVSKFCFIFLVAGDSCKCPMMICYQ